MPIQQSRNAAGIFSDESNWTRPRTRNDLIERLMKYGWNDQWKILQWMKQFQTWDALYDELQRMETGSSEPRNVTPITKQLPEGEKENV